jgi:hypothetical protein
MYKYLPNDVRTGEPATTVLRTTDGACIPFDPDNTDYQAYLKWVEAGNTPEPADEQGA